jgi:hypothetical protein
VLLPLHEQLQDVVLGGHAWLQGVTARRPVPVALPRACRWRRSRGG